MNLFDASLIYGSGSWVAFLWECLKETTLKREDYRIVAKLEKIESPEDIEKEVDLYLKWLWVDYIDTLLLHSNTTSSLDFWETHHLMSRLIWKKVRNLWASNFSYNETKYIIEEVWINLEYFEWVYNLDCKHYEESWFIGYCNSRDINFTAFQPLRRNRIAQANIPLLLELSNKYNKSQNQILLNRITKNIGINALVRSWNIEHVKENIASQDFTMNEDDYKLLNKYKNEKYMDVIIDWKNTWEWIRIAQVANQEF